MPNYLYVARFIREHYSQPLAAVAGFTATAKREVIEDLSAHLHDTLGLELQILDGGVERNNLQYDVLAVSRAEQIPQIHQLLTQELGQADSDGGDNGGAIVFTARRKSAETLASALSDLGWPCAAFHAGLEAGQKKTIQQDFIQGHLRVIVATNAFGMGVDKPDVRLVIHAEIPGSLENYLQEAGRAGRDRQQTRCILLYDETDVEAQFSLSAHSRLSRREIATILRLLRKHSAKAGSADIVLTAGEILAADDEAPDADADSGKSAALSSDDKVHIAIAWLERARFLRRTENHTRVFPGSLKINSLDAARERLSKVPLSQEQYQKYLDLISVLLNASSDEGISTDELMSALGVSSQRCVRMLQQLGELDLVSNDISHCPSWSLFAAILPGGRRCWSAPPPKPRISALLKTLNTPCSSA